MALADKRILIADGSPSMRVMLTFTLEQMGVSVVEAADGQDAFEKLHNGKHYDLVMSEVRMSRKDGFFLLEKIRGNQPTAKTPFLFLTAETADKYKMAARVGGATGYLAKPFDPSKLKEIVAEVLDEKWPLPETKPVPRTVTVSAPSVSSVSDKRVLIVDDDPGMRGKVRDVLGKIGFNNADEAEDGGRALIKLKTSPYNLVISDINMPHMDGFDLLNAIKDDDALKQVPVVIMTGSGNESYPYLAKRLGAAAFVHKADLRDRLGAEITGILGPVVQPIPALLPPVVNDAVDAAPQRSLWRAVRNLFSHAF